MRSLLSDRCKKRFRKRSFTGLTPVNKYINKTTQWNLWSYLVKLSHDLKVVITFMVKFEYQYWRSKDTLGVVLVACVLKLYRIWPASEWVRISPADYCRHWSQSIYIKGRPVWLIIHSHLHTHTLHKKRNVRHFLVVVETPYLPHCNSGKDKNKQFQPDVPTNQSNYKREGLHRTLILVRNLQHLIPFSRENSISENMTFCTLN